MSVAGGSLVRPQPCVVSEMVSGRAHDAELAVGQSATLLMRVYGNDNLTTFGRADLTRAWTPIYCTVDRRILRVRLLQACGLLLLS